MPQPENVEHRVMPVDPNAPSPFVEVPVITSEAAPDPLGDGAAYTVTINAPETIELIVGAFDAGQRVVVALCGAIWDPTPPVSGSCAVVSCEITRRGEVTAVLEDDDGRQITVKGWRDHD